MLGSPRSIHAAPVAPFTRFRSGGHDVERPARSRRDADRAPPLPHDDRRRLRGRARRAGARPGPGPRGEGRLHPAGHRAPRVRGAAGAQRAPAGGRRDQRSGRDQVPRRGEDHPAAGRHPEQGRAGQLGGRAPHRPGGHRADRPLLEPGGVLGPSGHREEQDPVPPAGHRGRQRTGGRAPLLLPHAAQRARDGHPHGGQHDRDGQERGHPDQARRDHARGRQLRHHHGQPRRGLRGQDGLRAGAAGALQPALARLHRRAVEGQGGPPGPSR